MQGGETAESVEQTVEQLSTLGDYLVFKVPTVEVKKVDQLAQRGFSFYELLTEFAVNRLPKLSKIENRYLERLAFSEMNEGEMLTVEDEIYAGMFENDHVALDPHLGIEKSRARYLGWFRDEKDIGSRLYKVEYAGEIVGFFILRPQEGGVIKSVLAGIFPRYQHLKAGFFLNYFAYEEGFSCGAKTIVTCYSSNNLGAVSLHARLEGSIHSQHYVLTKLISGQ